MKSLKSVMRSIAVLMVTFVVSVFVFTAIAMINDLNERLTAIEDARGEDSLGSHSLIIECSPDKSKVYVEIDYWAKEVVGVECAPPSQRSFVAIQPEERRGFCDSENGPEECWG